MLVTPDAIKGEFDGLGAFADDLAPVVANFDAVAGPVAELFNRFAHASGLHLNLEECVVAPSSDADNAYEIIKNSN